MLQIILRLVNGKIDSVQIPDNVEIMIMDYDTPNERKMDNIGDWYKEIILTSPLKGA